MGQTCCCEADDGKAAIVVQRTVDYRSLELDDSSAGDADLQQHGNYFDCEAEELSSIIAKGSNMENGKPYNFANGAVYTGQWKDGMRDGFGHQEWPDGTSYEGQWKSNCAAGNGRFTHSDGDMYIGQWEDNMANGMGSYIHNGLWTWAPPGVGHSLGLDTAWDGAQPGAGHSQRRQSYVGQWQNDLQDGYGVEIWQEGDRYEGEFRGGQKDGFGIYQWMDGSSYTGRWAKNFNNGNGVYIAVDGTIFRGQWKDSLMHGIGRCVWPGGNECNAHYESDQIHGFGVFQWPDGRRYEGFWHRGLPCDHMKYATWVAGKCPEEEASEQ